MVAFFKVQWCVLIGCGILCLDIVCGMTVASKDLATAASGKKSHKKYFSNGDGAEFENGHAKSSEDKGTGGYDNYETFHKDDGDSYAFEKHEGYGNNKKDDDEDHDFEEGYKYSHSSNSKKGDHGDNHNEEFAMGGSNESGEDAYGGSESYRRSYKNGESESSESEEEDSDNGESRKNGQIIYGSHPNGRNVVKQPSAPFKPSTHHPTHQQYMVFENTHNDTPKKGYNKKTSMSTASPSQYKKSDRSYETHEMMDPLKGYSSYVVHKVPKTNPVGKTISSSLVNVGASINVAGNGNYNEAQQYPHGLSRGYAGQNSKPKGEMKKPHKPNYSNSRDDEDEDEDDEDTYDRRDRAKKPFSYMSKADNY